MYKIRGLLFIVLFVLCVTNISGQDLIIKQVVSGQASILMPPDFVKMDAARLNLKYPLSGSRPGEVYTNSNASVNLTFNHTDKQATAADVKKHKAGLIELLTKQDGVQVISQREEIINGRGFIIIDFYSSALKGTIYNKMFITSLGGRMLIGSFNCVSSLKILWEKQADTIIHSFKLINNKP